MKLSDFHYELPNELIARYPPAQRSGSRLLVLEKNSGQISHHQFSDLPQYLEKGDLLVFNDTRVIPARLFGQKASGGKIEILIERIIDSQHALAHIRASRSPKIDAVIQLSESQTAVVIGRETNLFKLYFPDTQNLLDLLHHIGHVPLPPYMERADELADRERYQTVYSRVLGSVAAPTAGLHYDAALLEKLAQQGVESAFVTLHVGAGTFQPVKAEDITQHKMHSELINVSQAVCEAVNKAKQASRRVVAVGTTSVRSLETAAKDGVIKPYLGETDIFIYPGYEFRCIDALQTNFHLPQSTLLMLVSALAGHAETMQAYQAAIKEQYRFFSYGDTMLII